MGTSLALLVVGLAVGKDLPDWGRWSCMGAALLVIMAMVSSVGSARLELFESQTNLRKARRQRDEIELYFNSIMESLPTCIYFKDRESRFLRVNQAQGDHFGMDVRDLVGKADKDFLDPKTAAKNRQDEVNVIETGQGRERFLENEGLKDRHDAWFLSTKLPLRDKTGQIIGTFGISSNVTEMVETQQALQKERNNLRTLLDSIPDSIYIRNLEGKYIVVNKALAEMVGEEDPKQVAGKTPYDYFSQEKADRFMKEDNHVMAQCEAIRNTRRTYTTQKGELRHLLTTKVPVCDEDGKVIGIVGINRDITEQERDREAARQTEHRMQEIVDNSPSPMYAKSTNGQYLMVNHRYENLFGVKSEDVIGKTDSDIVSDPEVVHQLQENDRLVMDLGEPIQFDESLKIGDEELSYVSVKFPMRDLDGEIYAVGCISTDITERKQAERILQELNEELMQTHENLTNAHELLIQAEKMESVGRLAAGVAHEVKNPLAMIGMGLELLSKRLPPDDTKSHETVARMKRGIQRAKKIVRGLVDYSSNRRLEFHPCDPNKLVKGALELTEYQLVEGGVEIAFLPGSDLPDVEVDRTKVEQILVNLFINAMHAMDGGGTLAIRTELVNIQNVPHDEGSRLRERIREGDEMIRISITDTGKGISPEVIGKIFDPFFTTKSTGKGTGLGLTVARKIAELHGGDLALENRTNTPGTIATLTLRTKKEINPIT